MSKNILIKKNKLVNKNLKNSNRFVESILIDKELDNYDWDRYVNDNEDLIKAGIDNKEGAIKHWIKYGKNEGRKIYLLNEGKNEEKNERKNEERNNKEINEERNNKEINEEINKKTDKKYNFLNEKKIKKILFRKNINSNYINNNDLNNYDWDRYINENKDLIRASINTMEKALVHWVKHGKNEGRKIYLLNIKEINVIKININNFLNINTNNNDVFNYINKYLKKNGIELPNEYKLYYDSYYFIDDICRNKYVSIINPINNKIIMSDTYFILINETIIDYQNTYAFYYFHESNIVLCLDLGTGVGAMLTYIKYIYCMDNNIIYLSEYENEFNKNVFLSYYLPLIKKNINTINKYKIYDDKIYKTKIKSIYGFSVNLGHFLFNDYTGVYILDKQNIISKIDEIYFGNFDPYELEKYFNNKKISITHIDLKKINNYIDKGIIFKYNHHFISNDFNIFLKNNLTQHNRLIIDEELNKIKNYYPIINIVLRCGNRMMSKQSDVIIKFINDFIKIYPNSYFYFDGFTKNKSNNLNLGDSKISYDVICKDYNILINSIIIKLNTKNYKSLINLYSYEILRYLEIANFALYNCGSGCINSGWLCNIPGIQYGVPHIKIYEKMDKQIRENMCKIDYNDNISYINITKNKLDYNFIFNFNLCDELNKFIKNYK